MTTSVLKPLVYLHSNKGVKKLAFSLRCNREIQVVFKAPANTIKIVKGQVYIITKGVFENVAKSTSGRAVMVPYVGNWPRVTLVIQRIKEIIND